MNRVDSLLESLNSWQPASEGRNSLTKQLPEIGWTLTVVADRVDSIGVLVRDLTLTRTADAPEGLTLKGWADGIANRVSGLVEPLKVLEVDETTGVAMLRSATPSRRGSDALYYEVRLTGLTEAAVRRYQANVESGGSREQVAFALTHEVLTKLVSDIIG